MSIKSPKEKFQSSQIRIGQWAQIVANPLFDEACDAALLQFSEMLPKSLEMSSASFFQQFGAEQFCRVLKTIHEKTNQPTEQTPKGLNYQAGV